MYMYMYDDRQAAHDFAFGLVLCRVVSFLSHLLYCDDSHVHNNCMPLSLSIGVFGSLNCTCALHVHVHVYGKM